MPTNEERQERQRLQKEREERMLANAQAWEENATPEEKAEKEALRARTNKYLRDHR